MDVQLKELIETIKNEGVRSAEGKAAEILASAGAEAARTLETARREADAILSRAREEAARSERSGRDALKQAARDLLLNLKASITRIFDSVVTAEVAAALDGKVLEESIVTLMKGWDGKDLARIDLLLPEEKLGKLESGLRARLAAELAKGVEIKPSAGLKSGFLVSEKNGKAYYSFTAQTIAEVLSEYLNPRLAAILLEEGRSS